MFEVVMWIMLWWLVGYALSMLTAWALKNELELSDWVWASVFAWLGPIMWWVFLYNTKDME